MRNVSVWSPTFDANLSLHSPFAIRRHRVQRKGHRYQLGEGCVDQLLAGGVQVARDFLDGALDCARDRRSRVVSGVRDPHARIRDAAPEAVVAENAQIELQRRRRDVKILGNA